jgi:hypothetical protein
MMASEKSTRAARPKSDLMPSWALGVLCLLVIAATSAYFFRGAFNPANTIDGLDSSLWVPMSVQKWTHGLFVPRWISHFFAGVAQQIYFLSHGLPLTLTLPPHRYHGFQFMLDSFLAGAFMFAFLRSRKIGHYGALVGGLAYQLGNNLLTTASLGGVWKFATACWVPLFLLFFIRVIEERQDRLRNSIFAGAVLGLQFLGGEVQLSYYVGLLAVAYFAFDAAGRLWNARETKPLSEPLKDEGKRVLWAALCAALAVVFAAEVFCNYGSFTQVSENVGVRTAEDNWRFVTEFSFPPQETVALALTGRVFGTDAYPLEYRGQSMRRISDDYLGIVVLMFAFLALFSGNRSAYFFAGAAVVALLISYGRFFPLLFRLFYALPVMKGLRNPHKWLFITALCVPMLAGIGADFWRNAPPAKNRRILCMILIFFLLATVLVFISPSVTGNPVQTIPASVYGRLGLLAAVSCVGLIGLIAKAQNSRMAQTVLPLIILALLAGDLMHNASRFINYYDYRERYVDDELVQWLTSRQDSFRATLWSETPYLKHLMTQVLPYIGIGTPDVIASRRPARYSRVFEALRDERLPRGKYFQLFSIKYVISPPTSGGTDVPLTLATAFDSNRAATPLHKTYVYEFGDFLPHAHVVGEFEVAPSGDILALIGRPDFDLRQTVALEKQPDLASDTDTENPVWDIRDFSHTPHKVSMRVSSNKPGILVLHDFNDPKWRAYVEDREVEVLQANYLMRAIVVPEGEHAVTFAYDPPLWGFVVTLAGWAVVLLLAGGAGIAKLRGSRAGGAPAE